MTDTLPGVNKFWLALKKFKQRDFKACIQLCTEILDQTPNDQAVWLLKCRALSVEAYIDESEVEDEGIGDLILDEHAVASLPRPGTSIQKPSTSSNTRGDANIRPMLSRGRPVTGFARPGTHSRGNLTSSQSSIRDIRSALKSSGRAGTAKPLTSQGREVRLGTASIMSQLSENGGSSGAFIDVSRIDTQKFANRPALAMALCRYILVVEQNPRLCLEIASLCTEYAEFKSWWWKYLIAVCFRKLGLLKEAEKQILSSIRILPTLTNTLEAAKVLVRLDQPSRALEMMDLINPPVPRSIIEKARIKEKVGESEESILLFKQALALQSGNVECISMIAYHYFYLQFPEISLNYYQRLLFMSFENQDSIELWNNLALSCFFANQFDLALHCFKKCLFLAQLLPLDTEPEKELLGDIWYNISHLAVGLGDISFAYQALNNCLLHAPNHPEALNNLGILELRKSANFTKARHFLTSSAKFGQGFLFEPFYNGALLADRFGEFEKALSLVEEALDIFPTHSDSLELKSTLVQHFSSV